MEFSPRNRRRRRLSPRTPTSPRVTVFRHTLPHLEDSPHPSCAFITYTSEEQIEVYRSCAFQVTVGVHYAGAVSMQAFLPATDSLLLPYLDLPLLITIYFGMALSANLDFRPADGAAIGLVQDMMGPLSD